MSSWGSAQWDRLRQRVPPVDHLSKALGRYLEDSGDRAAAGVTYYGFLCLFPLLLLVGSVVGLVVGSDPQAQLRLLGHLSDFAPESLAFQLVRLVTERAGITGALGLVGLIVAGLGWVDALRESLRAVWHQERHRGNVVVKKLHDLLILGGLGVAVLLSVAVSAVATTVTGQALTVAGVDEDQPATAAILRVVALALALASDTAILTYLLIWLPRQAEPLRRVLLGAMFGAIALEIAKYVGFFYFGVLIQRGTDLYGGALAAAFGLLLWINLAARIVMFTAAWTVTAPFREDVAPSGTA